jgi:hypothetical protein
MVLCAVDISVGKGSIEIVLILQVEVRNITQVTNKQEAGLSTT